MPEASVRRDGVGLPRAGVVVITNLGGLVVDGRSGFRGPRWPNGPPSPRLAPGGFYAVPRVE